MRKGRIVKIVVLIVVIPILLFVVFLELRRKPSHICTPDELIEKYNKEKSGIYNKALYGVGAKQSFFYDFAYDFSEDSIAEWRKIITVHTERHCQEESRLETGVRVVSTKNGCRVEVFPIEQALASKSDYKIEYSWGSAPIYYLAIRYDQKAFKKRILDQPMIVPFTLQSFCDVPNLKGEVDEKGVFRLHWNPVKNAKEYRIYNYWCDEEVGTEKTVSGMQNGYHRGSFLYEGSVHQTTYEGFSGEEKNRVSIHSYKDGTEIVIGQNYGVQGEYYVTAVVDGKESIMSNGVCTEGCQFPYKMEEEQDILYKRYEKAEELPLSVPVENTDGTISRRNVLYTFNQATTMFGEKQRQYRYSIEGTCLKGYVVMTGGKKEKYPKTVGTPSLAGRKEPVDELNKVPQVKEGWQGKREKREAVVQNTEYYIKAESAAEEWLALNLIAGEKQIYIGDFPELSDPNYLRDVFYHVYYQNPYVFGIAAFACDYEEQTLHIEYIYSAQERERMRREMTEEAQKILEETNLSEKEAERRSTEEKIQILYQWLENHTSYDWKAYEESVVHQHQKNGVTYEYAHNAWGILLKKKGMCQGYSDAFLLLCHMAGVEAVAVTGSINQSIAHVWNAVCLEGSWYYVDTTNNRHNTGMPPLLYLAGEKRAKEKHYVRERGAWENRELYISQHNFYTK